MAELDPDAFCARVLPRLVGSMSLYTGDRNTGEEVAHTETYRGILREDPPGEQIAKIVTCEPRAGSVQISVWGAASATPEDVAVSIAGNTITIDIDATAQDGPGSR